MGMPEVAVIGAQGFIGANLCEHLQAKGMRVTPMTHNTRLETFADAVFDSVYFCAGNAKTFLSSKEPTHCLNKSVTELYRYLTQLKYIKFILVSSITVYPEKLAEKCEDIDLGLNNLSLYGAHKLLAERYVKEFAGSWVIARASGFFGPGLKKNLLYDLKTGQTNIYLQEDSWIDYMPISFFCDALRTLAERAHNVVINVGSAAPLSVRELIDLRSNNYVFHDERLQDDRNLVLDRLRRLYPIKIERQELFEQVKAFVLSA